VRIDRVASLNTYYQVSQTFRAMAKFGIGLHHSCKDGESKVYWCVLRRPDGTYIHVDIRTIPLGSKTSLMTDRKNEAIAKVTTRQRLASFEVLLNNSFDTLEQLLRHAESAQPV
jgi:hypothetical protein